MAEKEPKSEAGSKQSSTKEQVSAKPDEITREAIHQLGGKLDQFAEGLSENERVTLAAAFALAGRGFQTFPGSVGCEHGFRVGVGEGKIIVERLSGTGPAPKLSAALADAFCPAGASQFSIEGLEVERPMYGAKSVAAHGAKSVAAAACRTPFMAAGAKSVAAAACRTPFMAAGAKSVAAAACRTPFMAAGAKSVAAAACRTPFMAAGAKSVAAAACRTPFMAAGAKSVAAAACRTPFMAAGAKSVAAAACRTLGQGCY